MKNRPMHLVRLILILCLLCISALSSQNLGLQDSTRALSVNELRHVSQLLTELQYRRVKDSLQVLQASNYEKIIAGCEAKDAIHRERENILLNQISELQPHWYNSAWWPVAAGALTILLIIK